MSRQLDALAAERSEKRMLRLIILIVAALGAVGMYFAWAMPKSVDIHIAPDIRAGDSVHVADGVADVPPPNVYAFAYYIWQQVNRWQDDGAKDYGMQIYRLQSYITPSCRAQLEADLQQRSRSNELKQRTRQMAEIPGLGFAANRVVADGTGAWIALLDMQLQETYHGARVKDTFVRYPVRVVRFDVDRERNPWGLAIDCYGTRHPERLDPAAVQAIAAGNESADLPTRVAPVALPAVGEAVIAPEPTAPAAAAGAAEASAAQPDPASKQP